MSGGDLGYGRKKLIDNIINSHWKDGKTQFNYQEILFIVQEMMRDEGQEYLEGQSIHRGYEVFRNFVKYLLYRNVSNFDALITLTGEKGLGKSSAGIMIAKEWCNLLGKKFDPDTMIAYNNKDFSNKIDKMEKFGVILADEAVRFACCCPNTVVTIKENNKKKDIKIKELFGRKNFKILSYNEKTKKKEFKLAKECIQPKKDIVYEIELEDGKKIQATKEHKFLTTNGWKELHDLEEGDDLVEI